MSRPTLDESLCRVDQATFLLAAIRRGGGMVELASRGGQTALDVHLPRGMWAESGNELEPRVMDLVAEMIEVLRAERPRRRRRWRKT